MTEDQANQLITLLTTVTQQADTLIWLGSAAVLGIGIIWGALQWRLWLLSKNQKHFW